MKGGKLRHLIDIKRPEVTKNAYNEPETYYVDHLCLYARKMQPRGREFFADGVVQSEITTIFQCRFYEGIDESMRVFYDNKEYDIRYVTDPDGMSEMMDIACVLRR